jgi:hypothetical protein
MVSRTSAPLPMSCQAASIQDVVSFSASSSSSLSAEKSQLEANPSAANVGGFV